MKCKWKDCNNKGSIPQLDKNRSQWAFLCEEHHKELEESIESMEPKAILQAWVRASGGPKKMVEGMGTND